MYYEIPCSRDNLLQGIFFLKLIKIKGKRIAIILSIDRLVRNYRTFLAVIPFDIQS